MHWSIVETISYTTWWCIVIVKYVFSQLVNKHSPTMFLKIKICIANHWKMYNNHKLWVPCHVIVALFETYDILNVILALHVKACWLRWISCKQNHYICEWCGRELEPLVVVLTLVVRCVPLHIDTPSYLGTSFGHVMSKLH